MKEHTNSQGANARAEDRDEELRRRARRLCRQILRNHDAGEALATLVLALGELTGDEALRARPEAARRAAAEAAALIARVEGELAEGAERVH
ncbi:MAG: hypothetical protein ACU85V_12290 [Gammaproteobacteria bacterium]